MSGERKRSVSDLSTNEITLSLLLHFKTDKAVLVSETAETEKVWLPLSLVSEGETGEETVEITLPEWLALQKGLI